MRARPPRTLSPAAYAGLVLASGAALLLGAGRLSYLYDPGEQFHKPASRAAAAALLEGRGLAYDKNLDLRLVLRELALASPVPDVVLLGSSVTANAHAAMLAGGETFLNLSVNGGTLVDAVGLLEAYERRGRWPRRAVLWLDGASFDPQRSDPRWRSLAGPIARLSRRLGVPVALPPGQGALIRLRQILSWSYVTGALRAGLRDGSLSRLRELPASRATERRVLRPDGSRSWGDFAPGRRGVARAAVEAVAGGYAARLAAFVRAPGGLRAGERMRLLDALLAHLARRGVEATLLTTPVAPAAAAALAESEAGRAVLAAYAQLDLELRRAARRHGARFAGRSLPDPERPLCGADGHLDFHHLRDACLARHLAAALKPGPDPQRLAGAAPAALPAAPAEPD